MPRVFKKSLTSKTEAKEVGSFPLGHISASSMIKFSTNQILFKILYINRDNFETATSASGILGKAFHKAMEVYYGGSDTLIPGNESEAIEFGLKAGMEFAEAYNDGFINYSKTISNKQKIFDLLTFCFTNYVKEMPYKEDETIEVEDKIVEKIDVEWRGKQLTLPVKLKGYIDRVTKEDGKLKIRDYKTCYAYSSPDKIDGAKILQAVEYYLLAYAKYGEEPYSVIFEEVKYTKNADGSKQVRQYEIVFAENDLYFDFYFRFYEDMIRALNGEMVYVPNVHTMFDNEVSIIAYIHRLDQTEETAKLMKKHKVNTISELLKREIQGAGNMRKLMKSVEEKFVSAKNLNYEKMQNYEKIQTKMMEHGMMLQFDSIINGASVDLYRYTPSIGLKMSRIRQYTDDIEQVLGKTGIRVLAPIPGSNMIGFEVPKDERSFHTNQHTSNNLIVGLDVMGTPIELNIEEMPHLLVGGTTGSGKSVFLHEVIRQLGDKYEIHIFDPKGVDFDNGISDHFVIANMLIKLVEEMNKRYTVMKKAGQKKWSETGEKSTIVVIDEYNDLYMSKEKIQVGEKEEVKVFAKKTKKVLIPVYDTIGNVIDRNIKILAQKARSAGIHVILATQRPSVKVLDGDIKANFSTRISFKLPTVTDSKVILDQEGAEKLLGKGDGLLLKDGFITRFQAFSN